MNIQKMRQLASQFGLKSDVVDKTIQLAQQHGVIQNGEFVGSKEAFQSIVNANGGKSVLNKGLEKLNNPLVKGALKLAGIDIDKAKDAINSAVNGDSVSNNDTLAERLKKLK
jgi:hypothetical protein